MKNLTTNFIRHCPPVVACSNKSESVQESGSTHPFTQTTVVYFKVFR